MYFPEDGAAPAAAEPLTPTQGTDGAAAQPADVGSHQQAEPVIDRSKETPRHSLDRAFAALDREDAEAAKLANGAKPPAPGALERDEQGRFKAKDDAKAALLDLDPDALGKDRKVAADPKQAIATVEPPTRFSPDAKAAWKDVPDSVKGEVGRAVRELEGGIREYQTIFEPLKPYYEMARQKGVEVHDALQNYVALDMALVSQDGKQRLAAIEHLLGYAGVTPKEYAAFIMGQPAPTVDQTQAQHDQTILELRQEIASLKNQLGGVSQSIHQRREDETLRQVEAFADANPRLREPEFQKVVFRLLQTQMAPDLQGAYDMAMLLNPAPVQVVQTAALTAANPKPGAAQTRNGNLSITGAPGSGSDPAKRKAPASARESVDSAFASLGLG